MDHKNSWFIIINPKAGNDKAKAKWPKIKALLSKYLFSFDYAFTDYKGHAAELVKNAVNKGFTKIMCVGGDGTVHHVVNGIMHQNMYETSKITLGVIPIGTGNDWVKTYGIPKNIEKAIRLIKKEELYTQDIGKIEFLESKRPSVYFNNMAGVGFDGYVAKKAETLKHFGKLSYFIATLKSFYNYKNINVIVETQNNTISSNALMVLVGLCTFSGGGMRLTDSPEVDDSLFDVSILNDFTKWDVIRHINKLYSGKINKVQKIKLLKTSVLTIYTKATTKCFIQADGEVFPTENISFSIQKNALKLCYNSL